MAEGKQRGREERGVPSSEGGSSSPISYPLPALSSGQVGLLCCQPKASWPCLFNVTFILPKPQRRWRTFFYRHRWLLPRLSGQSSACGKTVPPSHQLQRSPIPKVSREEVASSPIPLPEFTQLQIFNPKALYAQTSTGCPCSRVSLTLLFTCSPSLAGSSLVTHSDGFHFQPPPSSPPLQMLSISPCG